jgi:hypothetical protein
MTTTMATLQAATDALKAETTALKAQVDQLTVTNVKLTEANASLQAALKAAQDNITAMQVSVDALDKKTADIIPLGKYVKIDTSMINGVKGPHILITGANVHVRNGSGTTDNNALPYQGLGNLIIGYNESPAVVSRAGSHNLVGGSLNSFSSVGGMVFGFQNTISGPYASVLGGNVNTAVGQNSTVYGGLSQTAVNLNSFMPLQGARPAPGQ